jgi:multicomponent Na+:H+ antiporter subunit C
VSVLTAHLPLVVFGILLLLGLAGLIFKRNLIKMLMAVTLLEAGINLFLVSLGHRKDGIAPIYTHAPEGPMALPTVQALTLTAIVIGVASTALMLSFAIHLYRHYGTTNITRINRLKG